MSICFFISVGQISINSKNLDWHFIIKMGLHCYPIARGDLPVDLNVWKFVWNVSCDRIGVPQSIFPLLASYVSDVTLTVRGWYISFKTDFSPSVYDSRSVSLSLTSKDSETDRGYRRCQCSCDATSFYDVTFLML